MKWTLQDMLNQRNRLDLGGSSYSFVGMIGVQECYDGTLMVWVHVDPGYGEDCNFREGDAMLDTFMQSNKYDRALFVMLVTMLNMKARPALAICLS
jgi:hypothetical protein